MPGKTNPRQCRPTAGRVEVCTENYGDSGWLGVTAFRFKDKHIKSAIVAVNDFYFGNPNIPELDEPYARRFVMCHELGHALGLDHRSGRSCVNDHVRISRATSDPDRHDYDQLERIYNHEDVRTTIESVDAGTGSEPASAPALPTGQEPELQGRPHVVVTDLGGGWKQVTFIDWVR